MTTRRLRAKLADMTVEEKTRYTKAAKEAFFGGGIVALVVFVWKATTKS